LASTPGRVHVGFVLFCGSGTDFCPSTSFFLVYHATNASYSYFFGRQINVTGDGFVK